MINAPNTRAERRLPYVVNDLVIREDVCNLACEYCLTGQSQFKEDHSLQKIFDPPRPLSCEPGSELHARLQAVLDGVAVQDVPVVKISGGEVMLIRGVMGFVRQLSERFETVVILTNGIPLSDLRLRELRVMGNVVIQLSLDSTRYAGNSYRVPNETVQRALMERVHRILGSGLEIEIYALLNDRAIADFATTCEDLAAYAERVTLFPFPVRGPERRRFLPRPEQHAAFLAELKRADRFSGLLPSQPYRDRLRRFLVEGERRFRCHLPRIAFTSFDDGTVTNCPNIWFNRVGNLLAEPADKVMDELRTSRFRKLLLSERPRIDACKACFTPWDPVSLYMEGEMSLEELARVPIYRGERTRKQLEAIRETLYETAAVRC
ncbi:MAG: radical SAM protein [bacterium]|nr:radical SAM protein [bacterium]